MKLPKAQAQDNRRELQSCPCQIFRLVVAEAVVNEISCRSKVLNGLVGDQQSMLDLFEDTSFIYKHLVVQMPPFTSSILHEIPTCKAHPVKRELTKPVHSIGPRDLFVTSDGCEVQSELWTLEWT